MKTYSKTLLGTSMLATLAASFCCISPLLAVVAGIGGVTSRFHYLEPLRPYLALLTLGFIGVAWYQHMRSAQKDACGCQTGKQKLFTESRAFLSIITVVAILMLTFPTYAHVFYPQTKLQALGVEQQSARKVEFKVKGMTCSGCEKHVEDQVSKIPGVVRVKASYDQSNTVVEFEPNKATVADLQKAIDSTGYKALSHKIL